MNREQHDDGAADSDEESEPCPMAGLTATPPFRGRMPRVDRRRRWARRCPSLRR